MGRLRSSIAPLEQYPFVNVFKLPTFDVTRKLTVRGDASQVTDPSLHRRVWNLKGDIPFNNSIMFPKDGESLMLTGRFVYMLLRGNPAKHNVIHLEVATSSGPAVRISFSNTFKEIKTGSTQFKVPLPEIGRWSVIATDLEMLFAIHYPNQLFKHLKSIQVCSSLSVRTILTSGLIYTPETLPYEAAFPCEGRAWSDQYDWYWINPPDHDDPAPLAPKPMHQQSRARSYISTPGSKRGPSQAAASVSTPTNVSLLSQEDDRPLLKLSYLLHASVRQILFGRGEKVMWAAGHTIIETDTKTRLQTYFTGHTRDVTNIFSDFNKRTLGSLQNTPPVLRLWDIVSKNLFCTVSLKEQGVTEVVTGCISDTMNTCLVLGKNDKKRAMFVLLDIGVQGSPSVVVKQATEADASQAVFVPQDAAKFVTCDGSSTLRFWRVHNNTLRSRCVTDKVRHHRYTYAAFEPTHRALPHGMLNLYAGTAEGYMHVIDYNAMTTVQVCRVHDGPVTCVSPCGGICATSGKDGYMRLWPLDFSSFTIETRLEEHVPFIDVSRDGMMVAALTASASVAILDFPTKNLFTLQHCHNQPVTMLKFHGSRPMVVSVSTDNTIRVWNTETTQCIAKYDCKMLNQKSYPASGLQPLDSHATSQTLPLMDTTLEESTSKPRARSSANDITPLCVDWLPDPNTAVLAVGFTKGVVRLFDADHRCLLASHTSHTSDVKQIKYTKNRKWLASVDMYQICFADARHGYHISRISRFLYPCKEVALAESMDGLHLATIGPNGSTISLFEAEYGYEIGVVQDFDPDAGSAGCITDIAFGAGGTLAAATSEGYVVQWKLPEPLPQPPAPEELDFGVPSPAIRVERLGRSGGGKCGGLLAMSGAGNWVACNACGSSSSSVAVSPHPIPTTHKVVRYPAHSSKFLAAAWSPDSTQLLTADANGAIAFWEFLADPNKIHSMVAPTPRRNLLRSPSRSPQSPYIPRPLADPSSLTINISTAEPTGTMHQGTKMFPSEQVRVFELTPSPYTPDELCSGMTPLNSLGCNTSAPSSVVSLQNGIGVASGGILAIEEAESHSVKLLLNTGYITTITTNTDKSTIAVALHYTDAPATVAFWDLAGGTYLCLGSKTVETAYIQSLAWGSDDTLLVVGQNAVFVTGMTIGVVVKKDISGVTEAVPVPDGFVMVSQKTITSCFARGNMWFSTLVVGLQCCVNEVGENSVWTGGCDGWLMCWIIDPTHKPLLKYKYLLNEGRGPVTGLCFTGKTLYATGSHGHPCVTLMCVSRNEEGINLTVIGRVNVGSGVPRCTPCLLQSTPKQCLVTTGEGSVWSLVGDEGMLYKELPTFDTDPKYLYCGANFVAVASNTVVGLWHVSGAYIASGVTRSEVKALAIHETLEVVTGEADGCISIMCTDGTKKLKERHRFKLSENSVSDMVWGMEDELIVGDVNGGVYFLNVMERDNALVIVEPGEDGPSVLRVAQHAGEKILHKSVQKGTLTVLERGEDVEFSVVASFTPREFSPDAQLTSDGDAVVFLQSDQLIIFDYDSLSVINTIHLPSSYTSFLLSPDKVYVALWGPSTSRLTLCDYEYHTIQEIDGHITPITAAAFDPTGRCFFSVSGSRHDFELVKWDVTQLVA